MVAIIGSVVCQEEEFLFLYRGSAPIGRDARRLVAMVRMVVIARCFDVPESAQLTENKGDDRIKPLIFYSVFERIRTGAQLYRFRVKPSAGTLVNLLPAAFPATPRAPKSHERIDSRLSGRW